MRLHALIVVLLAACGTKKPPTSPTTPAEGKAGSGVVQPELGQAEPKTPLEQTCGGRAMTVKFYDAGQALAALVTLPDGQRILVDAGESPTRAFCGPACKQWHNRVIDGLGKDIGQNGRIDLLWVTHQHSDHLGGVPGVAANFQIASYAHNGTNLTNAPTAAALSAAQKDKAAMIVIKPGQTTIPISAKDVKLTAIVPDSWDDAECDKDPNDCSIMLRIDYCSASVLFTGDAEVGEESLVAADPVDVLQIGHHGSETSRSAPFIAKVQPKIAVISAGVAFEGTNDGICHPRKKTIEALTAAMGGAGGKIVHSFDGKHSCKKKTNTPAQWVNVAAADSILVTSRDGWINLTTTGNGQFSVATEK